MANESVDLNKMDHTLMTAQLKDQLCQYLKDVLADHGAATSQNPLNF
jgi:hypothetical protein